MDKILSIIVPSYNMEAYLPKCLGSLIIGDKELLDNLDVIVVNDGSKDRTSEIAHGFATKYPGVFRVIDKPNGHYGSCVNVGLAEARGLFVRVLDADDYAFERAFESFLRFIDVIAKEPTLVDVIISDYSRVYPNGHVFFNSDYGFPTGKAFALNAIKVQPCLFVGIHAITYRTSVLLDMRYRQTEGCSYTDIEWYSIPMLKVRSALYYPHKVFAYLLGRGGQTMEFETYRKSFATVIKLVCGLVDQYTDSIGTAEKASATYVENVVAGQVSGIYYNALIGRKGQRFACDLVQFDKRICERNRALYDLAAQSHVKMWRHKFFYVAEWRKRCTDRTFAFFFYRLFVCLAKRLGSVRLIFCKRLRFGEIN